MTKLLFRPHRGFLSEADERINWETYIITLENYGVLGFTNADINGGI